MIEITDDVIDARLVLNRLPSPSTGALVTFDGIVRNHARGKRVTHLFYECYREMAMRELARIRNEALSRWPIENVAIVHRTGRLEVGESSVFIAVSSAHRKEAFEACRFVIDTLKSTVPIWKKEHYDDGESWVETYGKES